MQLNSEEKMHAIRAVKQAISPSESYSGIASVTVVKNGDTNFHCNRVPIYSEYEAKYGQYRVSIMWEDCEGESSSGGLRDSYNTNYNKMDCINDSLVIHADSYDIIIDAYEN